MPKRRRSAREYHISGWTGDLGLVDDGVKGKGRVIVICAKRDMGKSVLSRWIMYVNHKVFYMGIGMSNVSSSWQDMEAAMPKMCVFPRFSEDTLKKLKKILDELSGDESWHVHHIYVSLDDVSEQKRGGPLHCKILRDIFMTGRHPNITTSICVQNPVQLDKEMRQNVDKFIMGREANTNVRKQMFAEFFAEHFDNDFSVFCDVANMCTSSFRWLVYDSQKAKTCKPAYFDEEKGRTVTTAEQCIFVIRAPPPDEIPHFRLGHRDVWLIDYLYRVRSQTLEAGAVLGKLLSLGGARGAPPAIPTLPAPTGGVLPVATTIEVDLDEREEEGGDTRDELDKMARVRRRPPKPVRRFAPLPIATLPGVRPPPTMAAGFRL